MTSHHDVAGVVAELRDPNAHYTSETNGDINLDRYIRWLLARCAIAADILESQAKALSDAEAERDRLRERLGPRGLEVVVIEGRGHYVNQAVKSEIERLRVDEYNRGYSDGVEWSSTHNDRALAAEARLADKEAELSIARQINHDLTDGITGTLQKDKIESLETRLAELSRAMTEVRDWLILAGDMTCREIPLGIIARAFTNAAKEKT